MRIRDLIKTSQSNLLRSKLRTFLTITAVFVGTFTISLTNGVGNGVKSYIDKQLGNVGVENAFIVQPQSPQGNPLSNEVREYDPAVKSGIFNNVLLTPQDITKIQSIKDVQKVTPNYALRLDYIATDGKKYVAQGQQYIAGLRVDMAAGRTLDIANANEVTIPVRYVSSLGLGSAEETIGKKLKLGYKNSQGVNAEKELTIVGVQQESLLGSSTIYISPILAQTIYAEQTAGIVSVENTYDSFMVEFDPNLSEDAQKNLKDLLVANNYTAQTIQDQIGTVSKVINGVLIVLNVFGIISLFVATFGIVNTLLMAVNERTSEIGLMKALGANSRTIFGIFSLEAASIGFWGAVSGIGVSMAVGAIVNSIASNNFLKDFVGFNLLEFPLADSGLILVGIIFLAFLAGTLPSLKASRLDPIKALRYE